MTNKFISIRSLSPENGSGMDRERLGNGSAIPCKLFTLLFVLLLGFGQMWGAETLVYTLDGTTTATGNAYASASDVTQSSKSWKVTANTEQNPWRIGGKSITNTDRTIYNVTNSSFSDNICKVTLDVGATASSLTVNSITLIVSTAQNGGGTVTNTETKTSNLTSTTVTFNRPSGQNWSNKYFKIVFNVTRSGSSGNGYVSFNNAKFYKNTYTVAYNSNGGSGTMTDSNSPYNEGATVTVKSNTFTAPANKEFDEWKTGASSGTSYAAGATFNITANTTLYAQWKDAAVACTNVISLSKGTATNGTVNTISVDEIATCSETASERRVTVTITPAACYNAPDALIYTGDGTATMQGSKTDNGNGTFSYVYQFAQNDNGSGTFGVTCTAKPAGKTVNFDAGAGTYTGGSLTETCDGSGITLPAATASGICKGWTTFAGWATAPVTDSTTTSGVTLYAAGSKYTPATNNMTLYAVYSKSKAGGTTPTDKKLTFGTSYATNASDLSEVTIFTGITASATNGTSNNPKYYTSSPGTWRMYVGSELTIASTIGKITQIAFTKNSDFSLAVKSGESGSLSSETWTYASGVNSVTFTVGGTTKLSAIEVTYQAASSTTYYCSDPNCCKEIGTISGVVTLSQIASGDDKGKLQATWSMASKTGLADNGIKINIYKVGTATAVHTSAALSKDATSYTWATAPDKCTEYYATLTTIKANNTYCEGEEQGQSENVTTAGYTITYNLTDDHVTKKSGDAPTSSCDGDIDAYYEAVSGYVLPSSVTVTNAGDEDENWTWNSSTGELTILAEGITGDVVVTITADEDACDPMTNPNVSIEKTYSGATLSWSSISHAAKYKVYIYNNDNSDLESNENVTGTSYTISETLTGLTTYKYRVDAVSENESSYCSSYTTGSFTTPDYPTVKLYYSENGELSAGVDQKILTNFTLPNTAAECNKTFIGWTTLTSYSHASTAPTPFMEKGATWQIPTNEKCTLYAVYADVTEASTTWDATAIGSLDASDVFVIVGNNGSNYAMPNDGGASAPTATAVTVTGTQITSTVAANLQWNITGNASGYTFYPNGSTATWLYLLADNNNGVRIGTGDAKVFTINGGYLYTTQTTSSRYVGIYNSADWRCYTNTTGNIAGQTFTFYKKNEVEASTTNYSLTCMGKVAKPSITGVTGGTTYESDQTVTITSATTGATIKYTTDGSDPASSATTMATGSSFTLSTNGTYTIRAIATKTDMTNSDEATPVSNVTIDKPYTTIASFIAGAPATAKKLVFTESSNAVVMGVNTNRIYIQDNTGGMCFYKSSHGKTWTTGKKVVGTITGAFSDAADGPRMTDANFGTCTATEDGEMPDAVVIDGAIDADDFTANACKLVTVSNLKFQAQSVTNNNSINIKQGETTYQIYNAFNKLTGHTLPLSTTACTVTGILGKNNSSVYQLLPIKAECIITGANAVLPTLDGEVGGVDEERATEVASGEKIELTAESGYTTTYKIGTESENEVSTSGTEVTISGSNNDIVVITAKATREYYADNSKAYYYKINDALTKYAITKLSASNGSFAVKNSGGSGITSSVAGATITLEASAADNYHFVNWAISNASTDADVTSSVSLSSSSDKEATFVMPAFGVKISATFGEDPYATVTFVKGATTAEGTAPDDQKVYVGQNATLPANTFTYAGHSFAGWEYNSTTYQPGDTYPVTAAGDIEFAAKWREKDINKDGQWELVTKVNELNSGDYVVIAQNAQGVTESATIGGSSNKYLSGVATVFSGENNEYITKTNLNNTTAVKYVLGGTSGAWTLTDDATGKMLQQTGNPSWVTENGSVWNIEITNGNAYLFPGTNNTTSRIMYNTSGGFRAYTTGPNQSLLLPQLYKFYRTAFIVSYDANGGEGAPDSQRADPDNGQVTLSNTEPTREGYDFTGWKDGNGNAKSGTITLTENTTLYAQWTPTPYNAAVGSVEDIVITATPEGESAIAEGSNADVAYGTEVTLAYSELNSAYLFVEWIVMKADDAETVVPVTSNKFTMPAYAVNISADVQAKASVILNVTYAANGGEGTMEGNPFEFTYEQEVTVAANPFEKAQYTFMGWQDQDENVYKPGDKFNIVKNMTLTAIWRANGAMYTITSNSAVSSSVSVPAGSTAVYEQTYSGNNGQMTEGNKTTLTLTGYTNKIIKKAIFSMKTNKTNGAGSILMTIGERTVINYPSDDFGTWFGDNTDSYKDIEVAIPDVLVNADEDIVVTMSASANSMYVESYTFEFANAEVYNSTTNIPAGEKEVIVVKDGGNVTFTGNVTAENLIIENGGKVDIAAGMELDVQDFYIGGTHGMSGQVTHAENLNVDGDAYFDFTLAVSGETAANQWHNFSVPFPVNAINGVYGYKEGEWKPLTNEVDYAIEDYHGELRKNGDYGWKKFRGTMTPGHTYSMTVNGDIQTYRFKKSGDYSFVADPTVNFSEHASSDSKNAGWNGLGNMRLCYSSIDNDDIAETTPEGQSTGRYVLVLDAESYNYVAYLLTNINLTVGSAFFIQASADGEMGFNEAQGGAGKIYAPARTQGKVAEPIMVTMSGERGTDHMYISADEDATSTYQIGRDMQRMFATSNPTTPLIYTMNYGGLKLAAEDAPMVNDKAVYTLQLYAPIAGEYTLKTDAVAEADVYLTYQGTILWNISESEYTVELNKGKTDGYGLLLQKKAPAVVTGVETVTGYGLQVTGVQKIVIDDHVFILRGGQMYDVNGKMVK